MTRYGTCVYAYGANGERAQKTDTATGHITAYQYDEFGNLRQADLPDGRTISYGIDGLNRRVTKSIDGQLQGSWLYKDALEPIAELDAAGNFVSLFAYGEKPHVPSLMRKGSTTYRIVSDHLGSVRQVINLSTGAVVQALDYDAWGNVLQDTNPGFQPFGFAGGLYDRDTGLVRFGARDYDPVSGRWTSKDPTRFTTGISNLYAYTSADPINKVDLTGLAEICSRPLQGFPGQGGLLRHDNIFYDDGTDSGFFDDDVIRPDRGHSKDEYSHCRYIGDDSIVLQAEETVQENWDNDWRVVDNNCQDCAGAVEEMVHKCSDKRSAWERATEFLRCFDSSLTEPGNPR